MDATSRKNKVQSSFKDNDHQVSIFVVSLEINKLIESIYWLYFTHNVSESAIKGTKVIFSPGKQLKEMQKTLTYKKT